MLFPATYFTFGSVEHDQLLHQHVETETMEEGITLPSYKAEMYVFSNCDEVEVIGNGVSQGIMKPSQAYEHLPHPPFQFTVHGYQIYGELEVIGYAQKQVVARKKVCTPQGMVKLQVVVDDVELTADGSDMTRLTVTAVDKNGTLCPYANRAISFSLEGPGVIVGENPVAMEAGRISVYVRATTEPGTIRVTARAYGVPDVAVQVTTKADLTPRL